jgi:hypothetical protein
VLHLGGSGEGLKGVSSGLSTHFQIKAKRDDIRTILSEMPTRVGSLAPKRVTRRVYRVPWINSLWHIDGHHKLIRWKIVIHGGIDRFSRMVTFMKASDNNRAESVTKAFEDAIAAYGLPSRVRADHGKENYGVMRIMEGVRGEFSISE